MKVFIEILIDFEGKIFTGVGIWTRDRPAWVFQVYAFRDFASQKKLTSLSKRSKSLSRGILLVTKSILLTTAVITVLFRDCFRTSRRSQEDHDGVERRQRHRSSQGDRGGVGHRGLHLGHGSEDDWSRPHEEGDQSQVDLVFIFCPKNGIKSIWHLF